MSVPPPLAPIELDPPLPPAPCSVAYVSYLQSHRHGWTYRIGYHAGADPGFLKGGGPGTDTRFFTSTPPLDIVRVTSSDLRKFEKHPTLGHSQAPPPWTLSAWRHPTSENLKNTPLLDIHKRGGSNFGPNVKKPTSWPKRGGSGPPGPPPWIRHCHARPLITQSWNTGGKSKHEAYSNPSTDKFSRHSTTLTTRPPH